MRVPRLVMVTGHRFGVSAFEGIFSSGAWLEERLQVPLIIGVAPAGAAATAGYADAAALAAWHRVPYVATADGRLATLGARIRDAGPDYLLVIGWSRLIGPDVLAIPARAAIGMHPSPLPAGRGRAPVPWTIIRGLKSTALTVFELAAGADTGPVVAAYRMRVRSRETAASLFCRMDRAHFTAGMELAAAMSHGAVSGVPQDDARASVWPKRTPADSEILPSMTMAQADALVRAQLGPYPRAFVVTGGCRVTIREVYAPGTYLRDNEDLRDNEVEFRCADGIVYLARDDQ